MEVRSRHLNHNLETADGSTDGTAWRAIRRALRLLANARAWPGWADQVGSDPRLGEDGTSGHCMRDLRSSDVNSYVGPVLRPPEATSGSPLLHAGRFAELRQLGLDMGFSLSRQPAHQVIYHAWSRRAPRVLSAAKDLLPNAAVILSPSPRLRTGSAKDLLLERRQSQRGARSERSEPTGARAEERTLAEPTAARPKPKPKGLDPAAPTSIAAGCAR